MFARTTATTPTTSTITPIAILVLILSLFTTGTFAQSTPATAANPARQCITHIGTITQNAVQYNHHVAESTVHSIRVLDDEGAPDELIIATARTGKAYINRRTDASTERIHDLVEHCVAELRANGAPDLVIASVIRAGNSGIQVIHASAYRAKARIDHATQLATDRSIPFGPSTIL
ncbi:MAG: hypothetical protein ACWA5W_01605 [Phycisphaerales bacterium]